MDQQRMLELQLKLSTRVDLGAAFRVLLPMLELQPQLSTRADSGASQEQVVSVDQQQTLELAHRLSTKAVSEADYLAQLPMQVIKLCNLDHGRTITSLLL